MSSFTTSHQGAAASAAMMRFQPPAQPELSGTRTTCIAGRSRWSIAAAAATSASSPLCTTTRVSTG
eukprot:1231615-Prymnesium_polylepis.1